MSITHRFVLLCSIINPMIELALADSPLARKLCKEKQLDVDYIETSAMFADDIKIDCPESLLLLHNSVWDWSLAHKKAVEQKDALALTKKRLELTKAPFFSIHIGFSAAKVQFKNGMQALSPTLERGELLQRMVENVKELNSILEVPLLLENLDYVPAAAYEYICEASFIKDLLEETDTYLLLDLAHAQVTASRFAISIGDYLSALPLNKVKQIHVSGPRTQDGILYDAHEPMLRRDYELLTSVLKKTNPWVITLEYKKDEGETLNMLEQIQSIINA